MKILLAYQSGQTNRTSPYITLLPTGLCYLHACLQRAQLESKLANFSAWSTAKIQKELSLFKPDVIGISQWTHNRHASLELARICRATLPDCTIVFGGGHATFCYEDVLHENSPVNLVVRGEGEATLLELTELLSQQKEWRAIAGISYRSGSEIISTPNRSLITDLDSLPSPAPYLTNSVGVDLEFQAEFIVTTRGCPSSCNFCSSPDFWGKKVRFRSPEAIVEEIATIQKQFGLLYFSIRDDTFTADRKRVLRFCQLLQEKALHILWNCQSRVTAIDEELVIAMKRAGCECIQLGIESGSPRILSYLGKNITIPQIKNACSVIKEIGINLSIYLISDTPGETKEDLDKTTELIRSISPNDGYISPLAYFPGTQLFNAAQESGAITSALFASSRDEALYATTANKKSTAVIMTALTSNTDINPQRFAQQKEQLGFCFTTNVIAGEWHRQQSNVRKAEQEFLEITRQQPENPWGWLLLGDLYSEIGRIQKGRECYAKVLLCVPKHGPALRAISKQ